MNMEKIINEIQEMYDILKGLKNTPASFDCETKIVETSKELKLVIESTSAFDGHKVTKKTAEFSAEDFLTTYIDVLKSGVKNLARVDAIVGRKEGEKHGT